MATYEQALEKAGPALALCSIDSKEGKIRRYVATAGKPILSMTADFGPGNELERETVEAFRLNKPAQEGETK